MFYYHICYDSIWNSQMWWKQLQLIEFRILFIYAIWNIVTFSWTLNFSFVNL